MPFFWFLSLPFWTGCGAWSLPTKVIAPGVLKCILNILKKSLNWYSALVKLVWNSLDISAVHLWSSLSNVKEELATDWGFSTLWSLVMWLFQRSVDRSPALWFRHSTSRVSPWSEHFQIWHHNHRIQIGRRQTWETSCWRRPTWDKRLSFTVPNQSEVRIWT